MHKVSLLAVLFTLALILGGCTAQFDAHAHWPGKYNAVETYETHPAKVVYRGYTPPMQDMDAPDGYTYAR